MQVRSAVCCRPTAEDAATRRDEVQASSHMLVGLRGPSLNHTPPSTDCQELLSAIPR